MKKYYKIAYTKKIGGEGEMNVIARNENEAINNAKNIRFTGSAFRVVKEISPTKETAKGNGIPMNY